MKITNERSTDTSLLLALRHSGEVVTLPGGVYGMPSPVLVCDDPCDNALFEMTGRRCFDPGFTARVRLVVDLVTGNAVWIPSHFKTELIKAEVHIDEDRQS